MARRLAAAVLTTMAMIGAAAGPATAGLADRVGATFAVMATDFIKAAQPIEGLLVSIDGASIYLDLGRAAGAQVGQELTVFRKGDTFVHPLTGKPLGRYEDFLGWAQIKRVDDKFSEAVFIPAPGKPGPRPEDGARISRARIRVAIAPTLDLSDSKADLRRVPYLLASVLERSKRFQTVDPLAVGDVFADNGMRVEELLTRPERAVSAAKNLEVTGWIVPVILERRGVTYLDVTWLSAITGTPLFSRRQPLLPAGSGVAAPRFPWEPPAEN